MPDKQSKQGGAQGDEKLLTLTEVSNRTQISMPTLQRYKKEYQRRIPSVGKGRRQRYPEEAVPVFIQLKEENLSKRGRPRKSAAAGARRGGKRKPPPKKSGVRKGRSQRAAAAGGEGLLTLTEVSERTNISYPTLQRYIKLYADQIPYEGTGRKRRYYPEAVEVFKKLRAESGRGGRKPAGRAKRAGGRRAAGGRKPAAGALPQDAEKRIRDLEKAYGQLERKFETLVEKLKKPRRVI